jgi:hypothetical protein
MASILKVDTIQDQSGNNIINESADTITIGASGDTITIPSGATLSNSGTLGAGMGKVLQVVSTTKTDSFSTTSATLVDITGLSATITPTNTSSKIMVLSSFIGSNASDSADQFQLVRDSTNIGVSTSGSTSNQTAILGSGASAAITYTVSIMFLDSPSTTSATTYKVQARRTVGTLYVGRNNSGTNGAISTITVMEIAG